MDWKRLLVVAVVAAMPLAASAAVPTTAPLDGRLLTAGGGPVSDGDYTLTFALYAAADATATVWSEQVAKVAVKGGAFSHELGSGKPLGQGVLAAPQGLWLGVTVGSEPELPKTPLRSVLYARRAELAEGLQCAECVDSAMLGPQVLAGYAKSADLSGYVKVSDLSEYVKASALSKVAWTGQYGDLLGLPVMAKVGAVCGSGLVVKGIKNDGGLECGAVAIAGGKCAAGEVVVEVKVDGGVVCGKAAVVGGKCEPGKVVTEVKADGGVVCGDTAAFGCSLLSDAPGTALLACGGKKAILQGILRSVKYYEYYPSEVFVDSNGAVNIDGGYWQTGPNGEKLVRATSRSGAGIGISTAKNLVPLNTSAKQDACGVLVVPAGTYDRVAMSLGGTFACAWNTVDGTSSCWGKFLNSNWPTPVACGAPYVSVGGPSGPVAQVALGKEFGCAVLQTGEISCWGAKDAGQTKVPAGTFKNVTASAYSACAIRTDGTAACWGSFDSLGTKPTQQLPAGKYASLHACGDFVCGLREDKTIACTGGAVAPPGLHDDVLLNPQPIVCGLSHAGSAACVLSNTKQISFDIPKDYIGAGLNPSGGLTLILPHGAAVNQAFDPPGYFSVPSKLVGGGYLF